MEAFLNEELKKLNLPCEFSVRVKDFIISYPYKTEAKQVEIAIGKDDYGYSYLDFVYNPETNAIEDIWINIEKEIRGKGYGRGLVNIMENLGRHLKCKCAGFSRDLDLNPSFWDHMNYKKLSNYREKRFD